MRFKCGVCRKTFRTENGLNWHLENIHDQVRTFEVADLSENDVGQQAADLHNPLAAVNAVAQGVAVVEKVQRMMGQSGPLPATQAELVELIEGVISEQVNDGNSPTSGLLDLRDLDLKAQIRQTIAELIADSDQFLRAHIEHRIDDRLQALTPTRREETKVKDEPDPLAPYLRDETPAKVEDESNALAPYLRDDKPAKLDPLSPWLRQRKLTKVAKMSADRSCPLSASGKRCDHLRPRREHAALRAIGFPETPIREQAIPVKVAAMESYFPGPLTGCLSHPQHKRSHDLESSPSRTWAVPKEDTESVDDMIIREVLQDIG